MNKTMYKVNTKFGEFITHNPEEDLIISNFLHRDQTWEPHIVNIISKNIKSGDIFLDIGANIGWHSFVAKHYGAEIIAFEPVLKNFEKLEANIGKSKKVYNCGLGNETTTKKMVLDPFNFGDNWIDESGNTEIKMVKLNDVIDVEDISKIKVIKMDVQGYESEVMKGGESIFNNLSSGSIVIIEVVPMDSKLDLDYIIKYANKARKMYVYPVWDPTNEADLYMTIQKCIDDNCMGFFDLVLEF